MDSHKKNRTIKLGKIRTSLFELIDISKAWIALSLAFTFIFMNINFLSGIGSISNIFSINFGIMFLISLLTAGLGFLLHELAHKFVAQYYGCEAEFRSMDQMLYFAVGLSLFVGFLFAAPGAVMIAGGVTRKENGIISVAGPLTNYILAGIFYLTSTVIPIFFIGYWINLWLGLFNMIPFGNFDGKKILSWNRYVWLSMVVAGIYFLF